MNFKTAETVTYRSQKSIPAWSASVTKNFNEMTHKLHFFMTAGTQILRILKVTWHFWYLENFTYRSMQLYYTYTKQILGHWAIFTKFCLFTSINTLSSKWRERGGTFFTTEVGQNPAHFYFSKDGNLLLPSVGWKVSHFKYFEESK
jgi:hypothetical protein